MQIDKNALPSIKQESWKYTNLSAIYSKNNISEILLESQQTKDYLQGFQLDAEENIIIILDGVLAIDYNKRLNNISKAEFNTDARNMSVLAKDNAKAFSITIPKDTKDSLTLIFVN
ncbi:MAG: Fe-S cluster assembly protein SufD, partial [Francisella sp.]